MGFEFPEVRDVAPKFVALLDKIAALGVRESELTNRSADLQKKGIRLPQVVGPEPPEPSMSLTEVAAREMLGEVAPEPRAPLAPRRDPEIDELRAIHHELEAIKEARDLIGRPPAGGGHSEFHRAHAEASRAYCDVVRPTYEKVAERFAKALVEFGEAWLEHAEFSEALRSKGILWARLRPMQMTNVASPLMRGGDLRRAVEWAIECGHAPADILPKRWTNPSPELRRAAERQAVDGFHAI